MQGEALVEAFAVVAEAQHVFVVDEAGVEFHAEFDFVVFHEVFHLGAEEDVETLMEIDGGVATGERLVAVVHAGEVDLGHQLVGIELHVVVVGAFNGVFGPWLRRGAIALLHDLSGVVAQGSPDLSFAPGVAVARREAVLRDRLHHRVFFLLYQLGQQSLLCVWTQLPDVLLMATKDGRHEDFFPVFVGHQQGGLVVAGQVRIVDDVGGIVRELFFLGEIAVMDNGVDMADGAVETNLVEVVVAAGVVEVEHAAVFKRLGQDAVGEALLRQVLEHVVFGAVIVGEEVELLVLEADFVVDLQGVVVAVRAEHDLVVVVGEDRVQVGVVVVGNLLQGVGKQVVDVDVGLAHACAGDDDFAALVGV